MGREGEEGSPCPNCGHRAPLDFCPSCGQEQADPRASLRVLLGGLVGELASLDGTLIRSLHALAVPGRLTREWMEGKRARSASPLRLYLVASVVFFLATVGLGFPGTALPEGLLQSAGDVSERLRQAESLLRTELRGAVTTLVVVLVPVLAALLKIVRWRSDRLLVDHLVFSLHYLSAFFVGLTLLWPFLVLGPLDPGVGSVALVGAVALAYLIAALRGAYGGGWLRSAAEALAVPLLALVALVAGGRPLVQGLAYEVGVAYGAWERAVVQEAGQLFAEWNRDRSDPALGARATALYGSVTPIELDDHDNVHLAELLLASGDTIAAHEVYSRVLRGTPTDAIALAGAIDLARSLGERSLARERAALLRSLDSATVESAREAYAEHPGLLELLDGLLRDTR